MTRIVTAGLVALTFLAGGAWLSVGNASAEGPITVPTVGNVAPITEPVVEPVTDMVLVSDTIAVITEPVVEPIAPITEPVVETVAPTIEPTGDIVGQRTEPVFDNIGPITEPMVNTIGQITEPVVETVAPVTQPVIENIAPITEPVVDIVGPLAEPVVETVAPVTEPVVGTIGPITQPVTQATAQTTGPGVEIVPAGAVPAIKSLVEESKGVLSRNSRVILTAHATGPLALLESAPPIAESGQPTAFASVGQALGQVLSSAVPGSFSPNSSPHTATAALFGVVLILFTGAVFRGLSTSNAVFFSIAYAPITPPA